MTRAVEAEASARPRARRASTPTHLELGHRAVGRRLAGLESVRVDRGALALQRHAAAPLGLRARRRTPRSPPRGPSPPEIPSQLDLDHRRPAGSTRRSARSRARRLRHPVDDQRLGVGLERPRAPGSRSRARSHASRSQLATRSRPPGSDRGRRRRPPRCRARRRRGRSGSRTRAHSSSGSSKSSSHRTRVPVGRKLGVAGAQRPAGLARRRGSGARRGGAGGGGRRRSVAAQVAALLARPSRRSPAPGAVRRSGDLRAAQARRPARHAAARRGAAHESLMRQRHSDAGRPPASSGTGSSCSRSSSSERPARGRS